MPPAQSSTHLLLATANNQPLNDDSTTTTTTTTTASSSTFVAPPAVTGHAPAVNAALLDEILAVAQDAARQAGDIIRENAAGAAVTQSKANARDLLTRIDPLCERIIQTCVRAKFPRHDFLGEEGVPPGPQASAAALQAKLVQASSSLSSTTSKTSSTTTTTTTTTKDDKDDDAWLWIVDPIDGTTNFVHGMPLCMPSIAATKAGAVMVAVIFDCHRDEMYHAIRGQGAYCNGKRIQVGTQAESLGQAVVAMGSPPGEESMQKSIAAIPHLMPRVRTLRFLGSAALMLAWVAHGGRLSAYWEWDLSAWDTAAGALLVTEAGGNMTDLQGRPYTLATRQMCASCGGAVHEELLRVLRQEAKIVE